MYNIVTFFTILLVDTLKVCIFVVLLLKLLLTG